MEVPDSYPITTKHEKIAKQFGVWWLFLNSVGMSSFLLFLACLGAGDNKYLCALISLLLMSWVIFIGKKDKFPEISKKLRASGKKEDTEFDKELWNENFPILVSPLTHFPYWLGLSSLTILAFVPFVFPMDLALYIPTFFRIEM